MALASFGRAKGRLIIGSASGNLGRLVLQELTGTCNVRSSQIIAVTRSPEKLSEYRDCGIEVRFGDYNHPESLQTAFRGGERLLLICTNSFMKERERHHQNAINAAVEAGVKHIVFTSMQTPAMYKKQMSQVADLYNTERMLQMASEQFGITYTLLGYNLWIESFLDWYGYAIPSGTLLTLPGSGRVAYVTRENSARAAAAALASDMRTKEKFEISGSEALDISYVADMVSKTLELKHPIRIQVVTAEELARFLPSHVPRDRRSIAEFYAWFMTEFEKNFRDGSLAEVHDGYFRLTGKQPDTFASWLGRNKDRYML